MDSKAVFTTDIKSEEHDPVIEKWDWNAVKNALDDATRKFFVAQKDFVEDHSLMNGRLLISTMAILFSGYAIAYDWLHPFPESRSTLIFCVIAYFITIGILTLYTTFVEKGFFLCVTHNKKNVWKASSKQKSKQEDVYILEVEFKSAGGSPVKISHESTVAKYFDQNGLLCAKEYYKDLAKFLPQAYEDKKRN